MTWSEIITRTREYLAGKGVPEADVAAELLAARLLHCGRGLLGSRLAEDVGTKYLEAMRRGMVRLVQGEPIQYVLGEWDFRHLTLTCDARALIPRPETEELVTRVLKDLTRRAAGNTAGGRGRPPLPDCEAGGGSRGTRDRTGLVVVDVCTGSGCILLSLADEFKGDALFLGLDLSPQAIALAQENAERTGLASRVHFAVADGLDDFDEPAMIDVLVANPPYIPSAEMAQLDRRITDYEPRMALEGGVDGLDFYRRFIADAFNLLKPGGSVFFEIGEGQGAAVAQLFEEYGFEEICVEKDYAGHDRYVSARLPEEAG